ncbi:MAG: GNAT family N-acetyltransferase [Burkholderiaceae bacterium]|nr:GNAT family N-acetyltransferase [Burkholderiaceae bacterium]
MSPIATERLTIRRFTLDDAAFIVELLNDPDWLRFIGDKAVRTEADARRYLAAGPLAMYELHGFGLCAVERNDDRSPIGMCGLIRREGLDDIDIGYAFLPAARGQGFAQEAAQAVLEYGLNALGIARIVAITDPDNTASSRLLQRIDMRFERHIRIADGGTPVALYAIER